MDKGPIPRDQGAVGEWGMFTFVYIRLRAWRLEPDDKGDDKDGRQSAATRHIQGRLIGRLTIVKPMITAHMA